MPEGMFDLKYGVAGICVMLTLLVLVKFGEAFLAMKEKKENLSDETMHKLNINVQDLTYSIRQLTDRVSSAEKALADLPKVNTDLRRFYAAIKTLAGDRWPKIREEILEDKFTI